MTHYYLQRMAVTTLLLAPLFASAWNQASAERCAEDDEPVRPPRMDAQTLVQEFYRSRSQSLMQESFKLRRTQGEEGQGLDTTAAVTEEEQPKAAAKTEERQQKAAAVEVAQQALPSTAPAQEVPRPAAAGRATRAARLAAARGALRMPLTPVRNASGSGTGSASSSSSSSSSSSGGYASHVVPSVLLSSGQQDGLFAPAARGQATGGTVQIALQADPGPNWNHSAVADAASTHAAAAEVPATPGAAARDMHLLSGMAVRVLIFVICVAMILRAVVYKVALPCRRPGSSSSAPAQPPALPAANLKAEGLGGPYLCPELVVPEGKECKLVVPRLRSALPGSGGKISVCDTHGVAVLKASVSFLSGPTGANSKPPKLQEVKRLVLTSVSGDTAFAFCRDMETATGGKPSRLTLYQRNEEAFAVLSADGFEADSGYSVVTSKGSTTYFRAGLKAGVMNATDDSGRLLAVIESGGSATSTVRIGQLVDAGLITLTLMAIDILEHE